MAFESILVGSGEIFIAPVGEAFPDADDAPAGNWVTLGDIDGGVTINKTQSTDEHEVDDESGPVKITRSAERMTIVANLAEATLDNLGEVFNKQDPSVDAGPPAIKTLNLYRGVGNVNEVAVLFRGGSPYGDFNAQYQIPRAAQIGDIGSAFVKDSKVLIPVEFTALVDPNAATAAEKFGSWVAQTA